MPLSIFTAVILAAGFWAAPSAHAVQIQKVQDRLFLSSSSCEAVDAITGELSKWLAQVAPGRLCRLRPVSGFGQWQEDISDCVPDFVNKYYGVTSKVDGPNCWNTVLVINGILPAVRFSNIHELANYLPSPLCRQILEGEERQPGDVGAIWLFEKGKLANDGHAFSYVAKDLAFYKDGVGHDRPYVFGPITESFRSFRTNMLKSCQVDGFKAKDCKVFLKYYRCKSLNSYLSSGSSLPNEFAEILEKYDQFELYLQKRVMNGLALSPRVNSDFKSFLQATNTLLNQHATPGVVAGKKVSFVLMSLRWRLDALRDQLVYLSDPLVNNVVDESNDFDRVISFYLTGIKPAGNVSINIEELFKNKLAK